MSSAIVLFAHGARDPRWAEPFQRLKTLVASRHPDGRVELAFLELMQPSLAEAIEALMKEGCEEIRIVPAFMAQGSHLRQDLPRMVGELQSRHPGLVLEITPALGEVEAVLTAMADWIALSAKTSL